MFLLAMLAAVVFAQGNRPTTAAPATDAPTQAPTAPPHVGPCPDNVTQHCRALYSAILTQCNGMASASFCVLTDAVPSRLCLLPSCNPETYCTCQRCRDGFALPQFGASNIAPIPEYDALCTGKCAVEVPYSCFEA